MPQPAELSEELPEPSVEIVLLRVAIQGYLHTNTRKKGDAFLNAVSHILADEENVALIFPIRPATRHAEIAKVRRQAGAMWRQLLPTFLAAMPEE